jgi:hypothetical protein
MAWAMSESLEFGDALPTNLAFDVEHVLRDLGWKLARLSCWMYASKRTGLRDVISVYHGLLIVAPAKVHLEESRDCAREDKSCRSRESSSQQSLMLV